MTHIPDVRLTKPRSETCSYCRTHFTRPWFEVNFQKSGILHQFYIRWAECSKCEKVIIALEEQVGADAKQKGLGLRDWEWVTTNAVTLWPQPKPPDNDPLTGLLRKAVFEATEASRISAAARAGTPLSLVLLDLDNFKAVNSGPDGLLAGDRILGAVGPIIAATAKGKGRAYRWGGEEFVVVLPDFDVDETTAFAQRLRKAIAAKPHGEPPIAVTASVGVATVPEHGADLMTLFDAADKAVKKAKAEGKNRVEVAGPATSNGEDAH